MLAEINVDMASPMTYYILEIVAAVLASGAFLLVMGKTQRLTSKNKVVTVQEYVPLAFSTGLVTITSWIAFIHTTVCLKDAAIAGAENVWPEYVYFFIVAGCGILTGLASVFTAVTSKQFRVSVYDMHESYVACAVVFGAVTVASVVATAVWGTQLVKENMDVAAPPTYIWTCKEHNEQSHTATNLADMQRFSQELGCKGWHYEESK